MAVQGADGEGSLAQTEPAGGTARLHLQTHPLKNEKARVGQEQDIAK